MEAPNSLLLTLKNEPIQVFDKSALQWLVPRNNPGFAEFVNKIASESAKVSLDSSSIRIIFRPKELNVLSLPFSSWSKAMTSKSCTSYGREIPLIRILIPPKRSSIQRFSKGPIVYGYIKTTKKQLYLRNKENQPFIHKPLCIMDFYVVESAQRQGHGLKLFNYVLEDEKVNAFDCAFDNPSKQFLSFLATHYNLNDPIWQSIRFVVFDKFFDNIQPESEVAGFSSKMNSRASSRRSSFGKEPVMSNVGVFLLIIVILFSGTVFITTKSAR